MKVSVKKAKDCKVQMSVEVDRDTVESRYREILRDFQKQAHLPGFREGKAPADLVEKRFADQAREEMLKSLIPEIYHESVRSQKVAPVSLPKISGVQYTRGQKLSFSAEFEEAPVVTIKNYKGIKLKREASDLTPEEVEKGLQSLLDSRAEFVALEEPRAVKPHDVVMADIELWQKDHFEAGRQDILLSVEPSDEDDFFTKIVGAAAGETREILKAGQPFSRVHVKEIRKKVVPALDEAFAKSLGQENVESLREALRKDLAAYKHSQSVEKMKSELFQKLLAMVDFPVPESLVTKQKERLIADTEKQIARAGLNDAGRQETLDKIGPESVVRAREQIKLYFILQKISEAEHIKADEIELEKRLQAMAHQSQRPLEEVRRVFEEDLRESLAEKQTVDFLIANARFEESQQ